MRTGLMYIELLDDIYLQNFRRDIPECEEELKKNDKK